MATMLRLRRPGSERAAARPPSRAPLLRPDCAVAALGRAVQERGGGVSAPLSAPTTKKGQLPASHPRPPARARAEGRNPDFQPLHLLRTRAARRRQQEQNGRAPGRPGHHRCDVLAARARSHPLELDRRRDARAAQLPARSLGRRLSHGVARTRAHQPVGRSAAADPVRVAHVRRRPRTQPRLQVPLPDRRDQRAGRRLPPHRSPPDPHGQRQKGSLHRRPRSGRRPDRAEHPQRSRARSGSRLGLAAARAHRRAGRGSARRARAETEDGPPLQGQETP